MPVESGYSICFRVGVLRSVELYELQTPNNNRNTQQ